MVSQDYCKGEYMGSGFRVQRGGSGQEVRKVRSFAAVTPGFCVCKKTMDCLDSFIKIIHDGLGHWRVLWAFPARRAKKKVKAWRPLERGHPCGFVSLLSYFFIAVGVCDAFKPRML